MKIAFLSILFLHSRLLDTQNKTALQQWSAKQVAVRGGAIAVTMPAAKVVILEQLTA